MIKQAQCDKRLFILDTNILMLDPTAIFRFDEHDVYLPMVVLEELDDHKQGRTEVARNVRQTNRIFDELLTGVSHEEIEAGIELPRSAHTEHNGQPGRVFFQTNLMVKPLPDQLPGHKADNTILATGLALQKQFPERGIVIVSKDINLRIKAGILGIHAEDYFNDKVVDDVSLLHTGTVNLPNDFWEKNSQDMDSWTENGRSFYRVNGPHMQNWYLNDCIYMDQDDGGFEAIVRSIDADSAVIECIRDFKQPKHAIWGITARNREQNFALNLLLDPDIDFVTLQGSAGSGKTLLALAAGLHQILDQQLYREIIMTRVTIPVGEDIGFLPGTEEEKMTPWMGALMDNLEVLHTSEVGGEWGKEATHDLLAKRIKIRSLNFMRGRTFLNRFIIIDEAQNLTSKQIKTLITRAGPGTKLVCLGDIGQIDTPYLTETNSGLTYAVDRFKNWQHSAQMTLVRGERSRLADFAANHL